MASATGGRVARLRKEQRALRQDVYERPGSAWLFVGLLIVGLALNFVLAPLPLVIWAPIAVVLLIGAWLAGRRSLARRAHPTRG